MNLTRLHQSGHVNCRSEEKDSRTTFTRTVYQVDAIKICQIIKRNENNCLYKSFGQLLNLASIDRQAKNVLLPTDVSDLICVAIHWNPSQCTTLDVEDLVSIIDPFVYLRELFSDVTTNNDTHIKQLNLIGLICFYGGSLEVFFSYEHSTAKWLFCFDGNVTVKSDWNAVRSKCIDFHLQPFLLIYANSQHNSVDIRQLLKRTVIQAKITSNERQSQAKHDCMTKQESLPMHANEVQHELYSFENLSKLSSFATLDSSMLFLPKSIITNHSSYINQETVVKVMQQQLLKKELLSSDVTSTLVHNRQKQKSEDTFSSEDSSLSSQRDSGFSNGMNDASSDDSSRESLAGNDQTDIECLVQPSEQRMDDHPLHMSLASTEYYLEQSLKHESASNYSSALESCQRALLLVDKVLNLTVHANTSLSTYARTRKNSLLLRMRSLRNRQIKQEEFNRTFAPISTSVDKTANVTAPILSSATRISRPKKTVKFSDSISLIVPTVDDNNDPPSEHLIHSFLRKLHQQHQLPSTTSDSDSDTPSSSSTDIPIGLMECSLCHKRFSKTIEIECYCSNCHFYMQRFQPTKS